MPAPVIDWVLAEWVAGRVAELGQGAGAGRARGRGAGGVRPLPTAELEAIAQDALRRVSAYTGLTPSEPIPRPESVGRREWVSANIASMRTLFAPLMERAAARLTRGKSTPKLWLALISSTEIGIAVGYLAQHVLGQYELTLIEDRAAGTRPRLLFVAPNLERALTQLGGEPREFLTWVTLHEVTHAAQFGSVPWLRTYLASLIGALMEGAEQRLDHRPRLALPRRATLARIGRAALHADLVAMVANEQERAIIDRAQAVMAVIEGHAEHVMDAVAPELLPSLPRMRAAIDARRQAQKGLSKLLGKLLGLDLKLRQYQQGKAFCDAIVAGAGSGALQYLFSGESALPTLAELDAPDRWLERHRAALTGRWPDPDI